MDELRSRHILEVTDSFLGDSVLMMCIHTREREALLLLDTRLNPLVGFEDSVVSVIVQYLHTVAG